jgi:RHS repeat-associated protein
VQNSFDALTGRMLNVCATNHSGACDGDVANISTGFDAVGNLLDRGDTLHGIAETFTYDQLNRLTAYTTAGGSTNLSRTMTYDSAGDITKKSDAGTYSYAGAQPHAVSSITGTIDGLTNPRFFYDSNGNMACMTSAAQCDQNAAKTVAWTSFNMVSGVKQGTTAVGLLYDPEHSRAQQTETEGTTLYLNDASLGAMAERFQPITGAVTWRNYITVDGHIVAERTTTGATVHVRYFVLDHLGSTAALTDETGALVESDAYDAWGKQRNAATGADDTTCSVPAQSFSNRGYTGHEQLGDGLCLVNMNARIYDPIIGRFMSPDDMIPDLYNGQNFNRYTYVDDNPLSYTDPTGHVECSSCTGASDMSAPLHITVYVDSDGEMHALGAGADADNAISHALNEAASHGGLSGSHLTLVSFGGVLFGAAVIPNHDLARGVAMVLEKENQVGQGKFSVHRPYSVEDRKITGIEENSELNHNQTLRDDRVPTEEKLRILGYIANNTGGFADNMQKLFDRDIKTESGVVRLYRFPAPGNGYMSEIVTGVPLGGDANGVMSPPPRTDMDLVLEGHIHPTGNPESSPTDKITSKDERVPGVIWYRNPDGSHGTTIFQGHPCSAMGPCP